MPSHLAVLFSSPFASVAPSSVWEQLQRPLIMALLFTLIGLAFFALTFWVIIKVSPFSIRKEIEEDQNTSLGIIIGAMILGIALIIAAAIHG